MIKISYLVSTHIALLFIASVLNAQASTPLPKEGYLKIENADVFSIQHMNGFKYQQTKLSSDYVANVIIGANWFGVEVFEKSSMKRLYRYYPIGVEFVEKSRDLNRSFPVYKYALQRTLVISPKNPDESVDAWITTNNGKIYDISIFFKSSTWNFYITWTESLLNKYLQ